MKISSTLSKWNSENKNILCLSIIWGAAIAFTAVFGREIYNTNCINALFISPTKTIITIINTFLFAIVFSAIGYFLFKLISKMAFIRPSIKPTKWYVYLIVFIVSWMLFFLAFLSAFRAYYPGNATYDFGTQGYYYFNLLPFSKHHPPLHSYFIFWAIDYGTKHGMLAETPYAWVQITLFSLILAGCITYLLSLRIRLPWILSMSLWFIINPTIAIFSIITTKDVLFGGFFLLASILCFKLCEQTEEMLKKPIFWILFDFAVLMSCLFRNNAIYAFVLADIVTVILLRKNWKKILILLLIPIICYFLIDKLVYSSLLGIEETESAEKLCVPMQQIANVVYEKGDELSDTEISFINRYIDYSQISSTYNPRFADPIKDLFNSEMYDADKLLFWKGWAKLGIHYPNSYISSFLSLNIPYWYYGANTIDPYSQVTYINVAKDSRSEETSLAPKALSFYEHFSTYEIAQRYPFLSIFFSITTPFWIITISLFALLSKKQFSLIPVICPSLFFMLTLIAGPVSCYRYVFPIVLMYPLFVILSFYKSDKSQITIIKGRRDAMCKRITEITSELQSIMARTGATNVADIDSTVLHKRDF